MFPTAGHKRIRLLPDQTHTHLKSFIDMQNKKDNTVSINVSLTTVATINIMTQSNNKIIRLEEYISKNYSECTSKTCHHTIWLNTSHMALTHPFPYQLPQASQQYKRIFKIKSSTCWIETSSSFFRNMTNYIRMKDESSGGKQAASSCITAMV